MTQKFLPFSRSSICYYMSGHGKQLLIAFHGYSNDSHIFDVLLPALQNDFIFISIDLPIHGNTRWRDGLFTSGKLNKIISQIIEKEKLPQVYMLMGFSLGGRIVMSLFQQFPQQVSSMILLAPDGLYQGKWYRFIAQSFIGTRITAYFLKHPETAMRILNWSKKNHIINAHVYLYAQGLLNSRRERMLLYARWTFMRKMRPSLKKVCKAINTYKVPVKLVFGKGDTITPEHNADYLLANAPSFVEFQEWEAGHLLLRERYYHQLSALFK